MTSIHYGHHACSRTLFLTFMCTVGKLVIFSKTLWFLVYLLPRVGFSKDLLFKNQLSLIILDDLFLSFSEWQLSWKEE